MLNIFLSGFFLRYFLFLFSLSIRLLPYLYLVPGNLPNFILMGITAVLFFFPFVLLLLHVRKKPSRCDSSPGCPPNDRARTYPSNRNQSTFRGRDKENVMQHAWRSRLVLMYC